MEELYFDFDGQSYKRGETPHDLGSFTCTEVGSGNVRTYFGLAADVSKLPTYCGNGSIAICTDTGDSYIFDKTNEAWILQ